MWRILRMGFLLILLLTACTQQQPTPTPSPTAEPTAEPSTTPLPTATSVFEAPTAIPRPVSSSSNDAANLRVLNAWTADQKVDFYLNLTLIGGRMKPGTHSDFVSFAPGSYEVRVLLGGSDPAEKPLASLPVTLQAQAALTVALYGPSDDPKLRAFQDDLTPLPADQARLHAVRLAPGETPVDLSFGPDGALLDGMVYEQTTNPFTLAPGTYDFELNTGTESAQISANNVFIGAREAVTVYILGAPDGTFALLILKDPVIVLGTLRIIHTVEEIPPFDFYLDGERVAQAIGYRQISDLLEVPPKRYKMAAYPAGANPEMGAESVEATVTIGAGGTINVLLMRINDRLALRSFEEVTREIRPTEALLVIINAAEGYPAISLDASDTGFESLTDIAYAGLSRSAKIRTDRTYNIRVRTSDRAEAYEELEAYEDISLDPGTLHTIIVTGAGTELEPIVEPVMLTSEIPVFVEEEIRSFSALRLIHANPELPPLILQLNDQTWVESVAFGEAVGYEIVIAGHCKLAAFIPGEEKPLLERELSLEEAHTVTLYLIGTANRPMTSIALDDAGGSIVRIGSRAAKVTFINALAQPEEIYVREVLDEDRTTDAIGGVLSAGSIPDTTIMHSGTAGFRLYRYEGRELLHEFTLDLPGGQNTVVLITEGEPYRIIMHSAELPEF